MIWPARLVRDRFVCGRTVDGRQRCPGDLGAYRQGESPMLEYGFTEDPVGSHHWRRTARAQRQAQLGRRPDGHNRPRLQRAPADTDYVVVAVRTHDDKIPPLPWLIKCPNCHGRNVVTTVQSVQS